MKADLARQFLDLIAKAAAFGKIHAGGHAFGINSLSFYSAMVADSDDAARDLGEYARERLAFHLRTLSHPKQRHPRITVAQHRRGVTREALTILTGYKRSSRDTYLQRLRARALVETEGGAVRAASTLFEVAR